MSSSNAPLTDPGPSDVRVEFAADINPALVDAFLEDAPLQVGRFSDSVSRLIGATPELQDVAQAQRVAHSLKGSANITGVVGIANLTHYAEDILDYLADNASLPPPALGEVLMETADCLAAMVESLVEGAEAPAQSLAVLRRLLDWRARLDQRAATAPERAPSAPAASEPSAPAAGAPARGDTQGSHSLRVPTKLMDGLLRLAGELAISNVQAQGAHRRMMGQATILREQYHLVRQRLLDMQDVVEIRGIPSGRRHSGMTMTGTAIERFDPLELDEYNELHSKSTALAEAVSDFCEIALGLRDELLKLDDTIAGQQRISKELSDSVLSARMVPVSVIEQRLRRGVRETCRATGKRANLEIAGLELQIDGDVLNALVDPLMHILRNAVDHGIESPEERERKGKPATGELRLEISRDGDNVLVSCDDDGRGFDVGRIRQVARERRLLSDDAAPTERELLQLTVLPGFSTRADATQVSGRGIGMDVVDKALTDLKGSMDIASRPNAGATVRLRVPLTLISMHVLLVRVGERVFGVPSASIEQVLFSDAGELRARGDDLEFSRQETDYRVRFLSELIGQGPAPEPGLPEKVLPLLLLDTDRGPCALFVDAAVDGRYLVVKRFGELTPKPAGVIGGAILGDGSVAPVLDLRELVRRAPVAVPVGEAEVVPPLEEEALAPQVLIVDDSLTARRMLSLTIADGGYRVRTAIDGLDAVEAIEEEKPDLVVTDLEMPRMNGLELAAHLRSEGATMDIPLLMVTSRSTDKHRGMAKAAGINAFVTKPYANEDLLERLEALLAKPAVAVSPET